MIKRFADYLNESQGMKPEDFDLDTRFDWVPEIMDKIEKVVLKAEKIQKDYSYNGRKNSDSFEFNIKTRTWPEFEKLRKTYNVDLDYIYQMWDTFLSDNLQIQADDIIDSSRFFEAWSQAGRSGGWLFLKYRDYLFDEPEDWIQERVNHLNDLTEEISEEDFELYQELKQASNPAYRFLRRIGTEPVSQDIISAEEESNNVKVILDGYYKRLVFLEKELEKVKNRIDTFWEDVEVDFEQFLESNIQQD
jgi:hypothetical protein